MQEDAYIYLQVLYASKYLYIWLSIAIYTYICTILAPERRARPIHSTFTAKKLVHTTHRYGAALPNFPAEGYSTNKATWTLGQQTELSSIQVIKQA